MSFNGAVTLSLQKSESGLSIATVNIRFNGAVTLSLQKSQTLWFL